MREKQIHCSLILLAVLLLFGTSRPVSAQTDDGISLSRIADSLYVEESIDSKEAKISPWKINTSLGSSFYYAPGYGAGSSIYAAPHLDYSATDRLSFHGGFIASQSFPLYTALREDAGALRSYTNLSMFVAASYRVSEDLIVYGSGIKSMLNPGFPGQNSNFSMDDISFGAAYSFGNFTIGASFHSGSHNSFGSSPFNSGRGIYSSPFYW